MELISTYVVKHYLAEKEELEGLPDCSFQSLTGRRFFIKDGEFFNEHQSSSTRTSFEFIPIGPFRLQIKEKVEDKDSADENSQE